MADEPTTPPTDDDETNAPALGADVDAAAIAETTKLPAGDAGTAPVAAPDDATTATPVVEVTQAPVAAAPVRADRWNPDRRSVVVTLVAVAALAGSFGLGWAAGAANEDGGDRRGGGRTERFDSGDARGGNGMRGGDSGMRGGRPGMAPGGGGERGERDASGERPDGFDEGFDGPRTRGGDAAPGRGGMAMRGGVVGTITKVDGDTLTIDAIGPEASGSTKVEVDDDVDVVVRGGGDRQEGSRDDLTEGVMIAAHGDGDTDDDDDAIEADRIVVLRAAR